MIFRVISNLRIAALRSLGMRIGHGCYFQHGHISWKQAHRVTFGADNHLGRGWEMTISNAGVVQFGADNSVSSGLKVLAAGLVKVGDGCLFGPNVVIIDNNHRIGPCGPIHDVSTKEVHIGNRCWLGAGSIILEGTILGDRCVVGAGTTVSGNFEAGSVIVGPRGRNREQAAQAGSRVIADVPDSRKPSDDSGNEAIRRPLDE
jgi:acetyltransferase-like isoleucine patch superfamily enzyme